MIKALTARSSRRSANPSSQPNPSMTVTASRAAARVTKQIARRWDDCQGVSSRRVRACDAGSSASVDDLPRLTPPSHADIVATPLHAGRVGAHVQANVDDWIEVERAA